MVLCPKSPECQAREHELEPLGEVGLGLGDDTQAGRKEAQRPPRSLEPAAAEGAPRTELAQPPWPPRLPAGPGWEAGAQPSGERTQEPASVS